MRVPTPYKVLLARFGDGRVAISGPSDVRAAAAECAAVTADVDAAIGDLLRRRAELVERIRTYRALAESQREFHDTLGNSDGGDPEQ